MSSKVERKLAAIMFTDIVGYTEQMSKDQDVALTLLDTKRNTLKPLIKKYKGTLVKEMGDGTLSHFSSVVDATNCSIELQSSLNGINNLNIRVGVHLGDTSFRDNDVFGDGVNIASRLEAMAPPGGILVSKNVYDELSSRKGYEGISLGLQSLKGVGRLIEVYGLKGDKLTEPNPNEYQENKIRVHSDDEVPSIAILPFENKGKKEDEFYAYGIISDLIADVTSAGRIRVASKKQIDDEGNLSIDELAKKLFVRYIATGDLWKMRDMFQLSIELYDTKDKKVVWSDSWQERWDNLPSIKNSISDGLLKALDTTSKVEKKLETTNPEAYEYYLRGKHKYEKRKNTDDTEIARGLINKALELDDNLIVAKVLLGITYSETGDYDKAMEIYAPALKQAEEFGDRRGMEYSFNNIGIVYHLKGDYEKALDHYERSLKISEELDNKRGMNKYLNNIGIIHTNKGDYDKALDYYERSLVFGEIVDKNGVGNSLNNIGNVYLYKGDCDRAVDFYGRSLEMCEEYCDKRGMGASLNNNGNGYFYKGDLEKALDYFNRSLKIREEIGDKRGMGHSLGNIGNIYLYKGNYDRAEGYLEKSLKLQKEIELKQADLMLETTTLLYFTYKNLGKEYDEKGIYILIKETVNIEFELNFSLYKLLEDSVYLETAYKQVQEKADNLETEVKAVFLSYPIPNAIIEEYEN